MLTTGQLALGSAGLVTKRPVGAVNQDHRSRRTDVHHPQVRRRSTGAWMWVCACGGASCRTTSRPATWRQAYIGALYHAGTLAA